MGRASVQILAALFVTIIGQQVRQSTQDVSGKDHFKLMEDSVQRIAIRLANIYNSTCNSNTCDCSQDLCEPLTKDSGKMCFNGSTSNLYNCSQSPEGGDCASIYVTESKGSVTYVREKGAYSPSVTQLSTICRAQQLDTTFKAISNESYETRIYTEYYAGTVDGSRRLFPGREETGREPDASSCRKYDSRKRPWYTGAISHPNHFVILIDCGSNMGKDVSTPNFGTRLSVAQNFAVELLDTVYKENYVNAFSFGASEDDTFNTSTFVHSDSSDPQIIDLKQKITTFSSAISVTTHSQFAKGLNLTLEAFSEKSSSNRLLNVIIFTDGSFTNGSFSADASVRDVLDQVKSSNVQLFIYGISSKQFDDGLQNLSKEVSGTYYRNVDSAELSEHNPLFTMQSYFGYLAASHQRLYGPVPFWGPNYQDYYNVGEIVTVAMPVFNSKSFVGVAAVDVILDELGHTGAVMRRGFTTELEATRLKQDAMNATNQNTVPVPATIDSCNLEKDKTTILCKTENGESGRNGTSGKCCEWCEISPPPSPHDILPPPSPPNIPPPPSPRDTKTMIPIILGSVFGVAVIAVIACFVVGRKRKAEVPAGRGPGTTGPVRPPKISPSSQMPWTEPL